MKRLTLILILFSIINNYSFAQSDTVIIEKSKEKVIIGGQAYYVHVVKKGETLFSLSNAYNITQKEIAKENPEIFLGLQIGQALKIPVVEKKSGKDKILSNDFIYHRVKKEQTLYSLSKKYNVSQEDIIACNDPMVRYGINLDQILKIPKSKDVVEAIQKIPVVEPLEDTIRVASQFIYYTVKTKDTLYSLIRFYEITEDILLEHNPFVSDGLVVGQVLKIPKVVDIESATVLIIPDEELGDTILYEKRTSIAYSDSVDFPDCKHIRGIQREPYQVALLLPLYLEKNDEEFYIDSSEVNDFGEKIYEKIFYNPFYIYPRSVTFVEFYEGLLLAIDTLKQKGLSINLHVYDTQNDTSRIKEILSFPEFASTDLIIGPIFNHEVRLVSEFSKDNQIKMISPLTDNLSLVDENPYLFQVNPSYNSQIDEFAKFVSGFGDKNIVLVHNGDSLGYSNIQMVKDKIFNNLSVDTLVNNIQFKEVVFKDSINVLEHALNEEIENVFVIPSNEEAFVTNVVTKLNTIKTFGHQVRVIGLSRWQRFKNIDPEYYFNLELCVATPFFIDYHHKDVKNFILKYRDTYKTEPTQMAVHAYDVGLYFLTAMMNYGKDFEQCIYNYKVNLLQADYRFVKWYETSGYENVDVDIVKYYDGYNIFRIDDFKKHTQSLLPSFE
ncbi:MAG: LysM peptidoglycan-binding domain-containing protein [Bacteroidales bacterium]|nr:LysM peptidoglycan-binding domain-containing protein [Bacteroidales bacterium]